MPANATIDARWKYETDIEPEPVEMEDVVRHVRRYDDPKDLPMTASGRSPAARSTSSILTPASNGGKQLTQETDQVPETLPFTPKWATIGEESATPLTHWRYAYFLAAVEFRSSNHRLATVFDEAGDLTPEGVSEDKHKTYSKLELLRSCYAESRKKRISISLVRQTTRRTYTTRYGARWSGASRCPMGRRTPFRGGRAASRSASRQSGCTATSSAIGTLAPG
ncbi:MAG: hypothetical protein U5J98_06925 [Halobacteriales archaeon]|nr:hypothetical protein [Halobacteriales archaeon]